MKNYRKAWPALLGILALFLGAWSFAPGAAVAAQATTATPAPTSRPLSFPSGLPADQKAVIQSLYNYNPDISAITTGSLVGSERTDLDVLWAHNYNMLQMLHVALDRARNPQLRAEVRLLYQMRYNDQLLLNQLETQVGGVTASPTPSVTTVVTETAAPTDTATAVETATAVGTATTAATAGVTESPTMAATAGATESATAAVTGSTTATTAAGTAMPSETPTTGAVTGTPEANVIPGTGSKVRPVSLSSVPVLPGTALGQLGFQTANLTAVFLNKMTHASDGQFDAAFIVQMNSALSLALDSAREVQITSTTPALQGVAQHFVQEDQLDLLLLQILGDRIFFGQSLGITFPAPAGSQPTPSATVSATTAASETATTPAETATAPAATESVTAPAATESVTAPAATESVTPVPSESATSQSFTAP